MYQASKKIGDAIAGSNRKFNTRLLENEKVLVESVKNFTITSGAEEITIGSAVASYVQATIENKGIALSGKEVSLEIGVEVDGEMEYIPMGLYTIQNPKIESNKVTFTAYDRLASRCNGAYYSKLSYPTDAVDILAEISTMTGVAIDTSTLQRGIQINQRAIIEEGDYNEETDESEVITTYVNPFDGYTYKETIGFIAGLFGKFAICGRTGMIEFRWYQDISYEIPSNIFYNDLQETEESFSIKRLTCDNSDQTLLSGSGATGISMQNPVMTQNILDGVYNTVQGLVFTPAALRFIGDTRLDIGDIITAVKNDGMKFTIPIISLITSYDGGLMQTIASYGNTAEEDDSDTKGPITEMAERVEYELAFVKKLMVDNLTATNATIKNLSGDVLKFKTGEFETLKTDVANFKQTFTDDLQASNAKINTLESDHATFKEATATNLNATNARIANIEADYLKATDAKLTYATITNLNTTNAEIAKLKTKDAEIDKLVATKATITDLNAAVGRVGVLESSYANLNTLVNGNLTSDNIQNLTLTSKNTTIENGMIKNAMIENLSFDKITGMDINTTNLTVHSSDGKSKWSDNTIQISDANRVRVQIGKDASNDYSMSVWDKNGNLIWDALGATEKTIQRKIIRDGIVADDANISGSKLDINSVIKEVNGSTTKLKSSTIVMNDKNQTLDVVFNEMETTVADNLSSAKLYADGKLSDAQKYALEQANSALSSAKSYADSAVDNIEVGGRNLLVQKNITQGYLSTDGKGSFIGSGGGDQTSDWIDVSGNKYITITLYEDFTNTNNSGRYCEYDADKNCINTVVYNPRQKSSIIIELKTTTKYIRVTAIECKTRRYKIETGNKPTDWTPAPEDTQSQIDNITEITTSHTTSISTMQGQISSLISEDTTIKGNYDTLLSRYNATVATVDSMKTTIGEHTTILNNQNDSIAAVTTKANTIESNLAGTTQTISEVKSGLTGTQERVTKVETSLTGLTTRVSSTETNLANLEIGGRNLLTGVSSYTKDTPFEKTDSRADGWIVYQNIITSIELEAGKKYVLQAKTDGNWTANHDTNGQDPSKKLVTLWLCSDTTNDFFDMRQGYVVFTPTVTAKYKLRVNQYSNGTDAYTIHLWDIKLEKGSKATDWTPAPEDVDQQITAAETIASQTADKFNWLVKSGTNSTDFELTDRTATLVASAINMNGLVTFSGLNTDLQNTINNKTNVSYLSLSSGGNNQACWKIATIKISGNYINQDIIIGVNHRDHGYTECRIQFKNAGNPDPGLASFRQTGRPSKCWRIIKTANSTWELYLYKTESWDGGHVVKYINPYHTTGNVSVTWSGENADLPSGTTTTEQMIADQTTIDGGIITTGYISADRIAAGSITADKIDVNSIFAKDITATGTITGANLIGATGTFSGQITATEGSIGNFNLNKALYLTNNSPYYFSQFCAEKVYGLINEGDIYIGSEGIYSYSWETGNMYIGDSGSIQADVSSSQGVCIENGEIYIYKSLYCKDYPTAYDDKYGLILAGGYVASANYSDGGSIDSFNFILSPNKFNINGKIYASNELQTGGDQVRIISGNIGCMLRNDSADFYILRTSSRDPYGGWTNDRPFRINWASNDITCGHNLTANDLIANSWLYCSEVHSSGAVVIASDSESYYWAHGFQMARGTSWGGVCIGDDSQGLRLYGTSIWASHSISTSDENLKENFTTLDQYEDFYMNLNPIGFNYIGDYDGKKTHFGFGAHKTEDILESEGYDSDKFAVVTHRPLVQEDIEKRFGKDVTVDIETEYGVSYTEFIALNTHMIQKTRKDLIYQAGRIDMQEAIINDLQTRLLQAEKTIKQLTQALA
ncbi:hypothetical protein G4915_05965 [Anaerostipes hadrus]|jgi:hypothetical protein|uniref:Neck appendage protein n=1 Tax=Siphoviridae sp. ctuvi3 TaxID=2825718 RepID=A0A8S5TZL2_9CAUD|nr:tail fiber domain-containing protein [Anaerostipes hadrus]NSH14267.1 hypothetical protein [Anaerostipes hadrus]NSH37424.1 hypothetical protein [Anaerostipes hadrus]NSH49008.1 hypothetical protein [Anaerostipes hadrus]DAF87618.1 MAG TPA: Neck appendage protein [Siphoviridae sp. ctuvi3]